MQCGAVQGSLSCTRNRLLVPSMQWLDYLRAGYVIFLVLGAIYISFPLYCMTTTPCAFLQHQTSLRKPSKNTSGSAKFRWSPSMSRFLSSLFLQVAEIVVFVLFYWVLSTFVLKL